MKLLGVTLYEECVVITFVVHEYILEEEPNLTCIDDSCGTRRVPAILIIPKETLVQPLLPYAVLVATITESDVSPAYTHHRRRNSEPGPRSHTGATRSLISGACRGPGETLEGNWRTPLGLRHAVV